MGRKTRKQKDPSELLDQYWTSSLAAQSLVGTLRAVLAGADVVIEPSAGRGTWLKAAEPHLREGCEVFALDIDPTVPALQNVQWNPQTADFLTAGPVLGAMVDQLEEQSGSRPSVVLIGNPPFSGHAGFPHVDMALRVAFGTSRFPRGGGAVGMLVPIGFLTSSSRHEWLQRYPPHVTFLSPRMKFEGPADKSMSGMQDIVWLVWSAAPKRAPDFVDWRNATNT